MAVFYPSIETIKKFKVPPTAGERALLNFLWKVLDDSYEVYFNPYLNGDRPDIIIMRKDYGVMIIEVKDWNLKHFELDDKKRWIYKQNNSIVKSPIDQVIKYKTNLYDLHVDDLLEEKINNIRNFQIVACSVYFHCATQREVDDLLVNPYNNEYDERDKRYQKFLAYNIDLIGRDSLSRDAFFKILEKRYLCHKTPSSLFNFSLYTNFKRLLSPALHLKNQGVTYNYTPKQRDLIFSNVLEQRVKGVFGSGKTTVLVARAVQAYKRALERNVHPRILILTYNITLKNFIHDKLMKVAEEFPLECFTIINYHQFINAELNNLNVEFDVPTDVEDVGSYLEASYYSNIALFEDHKDDIVKYDAVLIDEIQDYHRAWMDIVKNYFRDPNGDYVLFGDVKQNIYMQPVEQKDVVTNVRGVNELKKCFRSDFKIKDLAYAFQKNIFKERYEIDDYNEEDSIGPLGLKVDKEGYINYMYLQDVDPISTLYNIIRGNILNKASNISPNDIVVLGQSSNMLRRFDCYYRYVSREKTASMMETIEIMYLTHLKKTEVKSMDWFISITLQLSKTMFPKCKTLYDYQHTKILQTIAQLFSLYDIYDAYPDELLTRVNEECKKANINPTAFLAYMKHYQSHLADFRKVVYSDDFKIIRDNKKLHFWMNSGTIKISTIHSFKGWESEVVFLIIEKDDDSFLNVLNEELIYTGLTRCRRNLVIVNLGNRKWEEKLRPLIERVK